MRKPITAESLAKSRSHTHKADASEGLPSRQDAWGNPVRVEEQFCECGCSRFVLTMPNGRRQPGSWT